MSKKVLFVSHKKARCGVYEFGRSITDVLSCSKKYEFIRAECSSVDELRDAVARNKPAAIIYNYVPSVLPWVATRIAPMLYRNNIASIQVPQIGIIHDVTQRVADTAIAHKKRFLLDRGGGLVNSIFDFYIAPDPTLLLRNQLVYKTGRPVQQYKNTYQDPETPTIGSFGFGTPKKGFEQIIRLVQEEFDKAIIRLNIPPADFGDDSGISAGRIAEQCKAALSKPGIRLVVSHEFLDNNALLDFAAQNTINVFLYEDTGNRGLSSAIDIALSAQRPVAVSESVMFRHLFDVRPSVCVVKSSLRAIIENGFAPLRRHYDEWSLENLLWDYERIVDSVLTKWQQAPTPGSGLNRNWSGKSAEPAQDDMTPVCSPSYHPVQMPKEASWNRILDNRARELYRPAIDKLTELVPQAISRKIAEANVQQAFVFDTVWRHLCRYQSPKLLCIGSYEDTASMSLRKMGVEVEEIDPVVNYSLQEYVTKPSVVKGSYDIIFSTSVIEHDPDDESFVRCVADLLAPGGLFIMTCDYKDGWKPGDPKPDVDARFYTKGDLTHRLPPLMANCGLVDEPQWDCPRPDFFYQNKYRYTFATFVVRKRGKEEMPGLPMMASGRQPHK